MPFVLSLLSRTPYVRCNPSHSARRPRKFVGSMSSSGGPARRRPHVARPCRLFGRIQTGDALQCEGVVIDKERRLHGAFLRAAVTWRNLPTAPSLDNGPLWRLTCAGSALWSSRQDGLLVVAESDHQPFLSDRQLATAHYVL